MNRAAYILSLVLGFIATAMQAQTAADTICVNAGNTHFAVPYEAGHSYQWQVNGGAIVSRPDSNDIEVRWLTPGLHQVSVTAFSAEGCPGNTSTYYMQLIEPVVARAKGPSQVCSGDRVTLEALVEGQFEWMGGKKQQFLSFVAEKDTVVSLVALNGSCPNDTVHYSIDVYDAPVAGMNYVEDTVETGSTINLYYTGGGNTDIEWYLNGRFASSSKALQLDFNSPGEQEIIQYVWRGSCTDTIRRKIYVEDIYKVFIPNAFTPNNDGANDYFSFDGVGVKSYHAQIYNRWGQRLFEWNENSPVEGWDGTYRGQESKIDSYIYKIYVEDMSGKVHYYTSDFALIR